MSNAHARKLFVLIYFRFHLFCKDSFLKTFTKWLQMLLKENFWAWMKKRYVIVKLNTRLGKVGVWTIEKWIFFWLRRSFGPNELRSVLPHWLMSKPIIKDHSNDLIMLNTIFTWYLTKIWKDLTSFQLVFCYGYWNLVTVSSAVASCICSDFISVFELAFCVFIKYVTLNRVVISICKGLEFVV